MPSALAQPQPLLSVEDYLEGEKRSEIRHEYLGGYIYAMAGASADHNRIAGDIHTELREQLRSKRCEPFMADMKLRVAATDTFYYPDVLVACDPTDKAKYFRERPTVVFEVLSPDTERTDQREKWLAYALVPSLKVYVIVSQEKCEVTVLRRAPGSAGILPANGAKAATLPWRAQTLTDLTSVLNLPEIKVKIPLERIYERTALFQEGRKRKQ
ncbi:MAG: hypothetical protein C5B50_24215 [Verrucomicrobia bacterium]|nr:MAG: hypothetical protein C5B50_24215 [Verrucomicrobiota bacterium]